MAVEKLAGKTKIVGNAHMESFVSKPPHGLKRDRSLKVAAMRASATNPDTKPTFPHGTP